MKLSHYQLDSVHLQSINAFTQNPAENTMTIDTYSGIDNDTIKKLQKEQYSQEEQFKKFTEELTRLSQKYGVILHVTGGVMFVNPEAPCLHHLQYSSDATSGDLEPINGYD